jgi:phospholipid/cholesterol/gamma-HCH transport system substrate-binding protein
VKRAIREHLKDVIATVVLVVVAAVVVGYILIQQRADFPEWVPGVGEDRFELQARFATSQAVTPGQGQTVNIAGIRAGSIQDVELDEGDAVVTMEIDNEYAPLIREDARFLLRPRTGLQDMTIEMDVGTQDAPQMEEGTEVSVAQTEPNVNPDEILAALDADTRDYLRLLLSGGAEALGDRGKQLSAVFRRFEPTTRDIAKFQGALASRRQNLERVITNFGLLLDELGKRDTELGRFVTSSNAVLDSFAAQEQAIRESLRELPSTLEETQKSLASAREFGEVVGPASEDLIPAAQALAPALRQVRPLFRDTVEPIEEQVRPATRELGEPIRNLDDAASGLAATTPALSKGFRDLNILANELAYNPPGAQEEGYLFWASWLSHNTNLISTLQDGNGPVLRGVVMITCGNTRLAEQVASQRPFLRVLFDITLTPTSEDICPPSDFPFKRDGDGDGEPDDLGFATPPSEDAAPIPEETPPEVGEPTTDPAEPDAPAEDSAGIDVAEGQDSGEATGEAGAADGSDIPPEAGP